MKVVLVIFFIGCFCVSCTKLLGDEPSTDVIGIFDEFWNGIDNYWPEFETKNVNWDSLKSVYRPLLAPYTSDIELIQIIDSLVYRLKDGHVNVFPKGYPAISYKVNFPKNFYGIQWIKQKYLAIVNGNQTIAYGLTNNDIGYVYVSSFNNQSSQYDIIDQIVKDLNDTKGIIIDVRDNGGGSTQSAATIARHFADKSRVYDYNRFRINKDRAQLSDYQAETIQPASSTMYLRKTAILMNRGSFSATENFILMMRSIPNVILIGDNSRGGSGSNPIFKELPRGWFLRVSTSILYDANKQSIHNGIAPDYSVSTTKADSLDGKDSIIERAIVELQK